MLGDAIAAIGLIKDWVQWTELDPMPVDEKWLELAKERDKLESDRNYVWSNANKVESRRLARTHELVWLVDEIKRTRQKIIRRDNLVLMARTEKP